MTFLQCHVLLCHKYILYCIFLYFLLLFHPHQPLTLPPASDANEHALLRRFAAGAVICTHVHAPSGLPLRDCSQGTTIYRLARIVAAPAGVAWASPAQVHYCLVYWRGADEAEGV